MFGAQSNMMIVNKKHAPSFELLYRHVQSYDSYRWKFTAERSNALCMQRMQDHISFEHCWRRQASMTFYYPQRNETGPILVPVEVEGSLCMQYSDSVSTKHMLDSLANGSTFASSVPTLAYSSTELTLGRCRGRDQERFWQDDLGKFHLKSHPNLCIGTGDKQLGHQFFQVPNIKHCTDGLSFQDHFEDVSILLTPEVASALLHGTAAASACLLIGLATIFLFKVVACFKNATRWADILKPSLEHLLHCLRTVARTRKLAVVEMKSVYRSRLAEGIINTSVWGLPCILLMNINVFLSAVRKSWASSGGTQGSSILASFDGVMRPGVDVLGRTHLLLGIACSTFAIIAQTRQGKLTSRFLDYGQLYFFVAWIGVLHVWSQCNNYADLAIQTLPLRLLLCIMCGNLPLGILLQALLGVIDAHVFFVQTNTNSKWFKIQTYSELHVAFFLLQCIVMMCLEHLLWSLAEAAVEASEGKSCLAALLDHTSDGHCVLSLPHGYIQEASYAMQASFANVPLTRRRLADLVQTQDRNLVHGLIKAASGGAATEPILVTCCVPVCSSPAVHSLTHPVFDVKIVPYSMTPTQLYVCICMHGERRPCHQVVDLEAGGQAQAFSHASAARPLTNLTEHWSHWSSGSDSSIAESRVAPSAKSAPTFLPDELEKARTEVVRLAACGSEGDCLPPSAAVQVRGLSGPPGWKEVGNLLRDDFVRCYDHLTGQLHFAQVLDVSGESGLCNWATVQCSDGTCLELTADHPVRSLDGRKMMKNLEVGKDKLLVTKMEEVVVENLTIREDLRPRVSVKYAQSQRFSMLVHQQIGQQSCVAVESSNYSPIVFRSKGTFLDVLDDCEDHSTCAARSAPGRLDAQVSSMCELPYSGNLIFDHGESGTRKFPSVEVTSRAYGEVQSSQNAFMDSAGSLGSTNHHLGLCTPCKFEFRHVSNPEKFAPCEKGRFCNYCHEQHSDEDIRRVRRIDQYAKKKEKRRKQSPCA